MRAGDRMERVTLDTPYGPMHIDVLAAIEVDDHVAGYGRRKLIMPTLRVTTYGIDGQWDQPGFIKIRGKKYSVDHVHVKTPPQWAEPWTSDSRTYVQRYTKTEAGNSLDWRSPTGKTIREIETGVRDRFAAAWEEWETWSLIKRLDWMIKHQDEQAASARKAVEAHERHAAGLREERAKLRRQKREAGE